MKSLPNQRLSWNTATLAVVLALMLLLPAKVTLAQNSPPIADAGPDQSIFIGEAAQLSGSAIDPDGDPIVAWT